MIAGAVAQGSLSWGTASRALAGERVSGDRSYVRRLSDGSTLLAVLDGAGHGAAAAEAAEAGRAILDRHAGMPLSRLFRACHDGLRGTRGVAMSLAHLGPRADRLTWIGIGNVEAILWRREPGALPRREFMVTRGGLVGCQMPIPFEASQPLSAGDLLVLATDGVRGDFGPLLNGCDPPQRIAERILDRHASGNDDALVLVVRTGGVS